MSRSIIYDSERGLTISDIVSLLFEGRTLVVGDKAMQRVEACYRFLRSFAAGRIIYGINTGFGPMAQYRVDDNQLKQLQYNIIRSHAAGAGASLPSVYVKAAMIARLSALLQARSGIHPEAITLLTELINRDICPYVPEHGSVGASGDLVQLAHIALVLIGEGKACRHGQWHPAADLLAAEGLLPLTMYIREGLSLTNGTSMMTGIGLVNLIHARRLLDRAVTASVMINEIVSSYSDHLAPELHRAKHHSGQQRIAELMRLRIAGSRAVRSREAELYHAPAGSTFDHKVQPYYSLRCVPQILGPVLEQLDATERTLIDELNSACDNPIVDPESQNIYHGGNFHGDYVGFEMDKLKIAITKLTLLAERQLNYLCHDRINGLLPPFVNLGVPGLNYGLQAAQFTATSTTAECQTLSNPMYIHSIPNNNDNQDVVSMGTNAALMARTVVENSYQVMAILYMALAQAVDCRSMRNELSPHSRRIYDEIRSLFPAFVDDAPLYDTIEQIKQYLLSPSKHPKSL